MATRARTQNQQPPKDWAPTQAVPNPILNNPYESPQSYWLYQNGVPSQVPGRRPARYYFKTKRIGSAQSDMDLFKEENEEDLPLVNALRKDVRRWHETDYRGASQVTRELLAWWLRKDSPRRLFFCQQEAVETLIYLLEIAIPGRLRTTGFQKFEVNQDQFSQLLTGVKPDFPGISSDFFPRLIDPATDSGQLALRRMACKMATGSGKTIVMAMIITWAFCNRSRNPASKNFPNGILVCAPNLTIKKRLQVLYPEDPDNYFDYFDLVPAKYRDCMAMGKVLVTNWHAFAPKNEHSEGGKSYAVVNKGDETPDAFTKDRLGDLTQRLPILVLNDEGHHCWRGRVESESEEKKLLKDRDSEEKQTLEEEAEEARVWLTGLDKINNSGLNGKDAQGKSESGIMACVDLSATPFYLANSGYPEGSPFQWIVSDFGLVDAIESGITKVPRLPVRDDVGTIDDAGRPDPKYFRLWRNINDNELKAEDYIQRTKPKPEAIYKYAEGALTTLASQWKKHFDKKREDAHGGPFTPPVLIVVCNNTDIADVFYRKISGESEIDTMDVEGNSIKTKRFDPSTILPDLANSENFQHTIRIDSKLLKKIETEEGESKDQAALRLRELIDTVGKRGGAGEQVRCVVSVSMLTEGWDANNVTHILGVRAFDSQLLCEQVVGRGLRRMSYFPDPVTGKLNPEYVDVYGIPFSLIPFKGKPKEEEEGDPVYHDIYAVRERAHFELRMPNVESYVYALRDSGIQCDVDKLEGLIIDREPGEVWLAPTRGYQDDPSARGAEESFIKQTRDEYYAAVRPQQIIFRLAQLILDDLLQGAQSENHEKGKIKYLARHQLFPEIVRIVRTYIDTKVILKEGVDIRELGLERYAQALRERIRDNILPAAAKEDARLLPVLNSFQPFTTTANVNYQTTRPVEDMEKSHLNRAMIQSGWERRAIAIMEKMDCVECFTPNDRQIGLIIPYDIEGHRHHYEPDFIVKLQNNLFILLEIKGEAGRIHNEDQVLAKNAAAKKWVAAVNNSGRFGSWVFEICEDMDKLSFILSSHAGVIDNFRPFRFVQADKNAIWKDCVPLTTLKAAAGQFSMDQENLDSDGSWSEDWVTWDDHPAFEEGMFVAKVVGKSMEPVIPDNSYCLFRKSRGGTRQGKVLLVWHSGVTDPSTGGQYTIKVYESEKRGKEEGEWEHTRIILKPTNPDFSPISLEPKDEGAVRVIAEFVCIVG
jgi:type III restriction enzyme